jgi:hypothetical protein
MAGLLLARPSREAESETQVGDDRFKILLNDPP